jgi:hypothetical protein
LITLSKFQGILVAGIAIRLGMAPFFAHVFDMYSFYVIGDAFVRGAQPLRDYLVPYSYSYFLFLFPATAAFEAISRVFGSTVIPISSLNPALNPGPQWNVTLVPGLLFDFLEKLPLIVSDTIIATLIYRMVEEHTHDRRLALSATTLWFLNPLSIWVTSGWGMFDTLPTLFTVLALYFVLAGKFYYSAASIVVGVAMKYYPVFLIFPLLLIAWRDGGRKGLLQAVGGTALSGAVLFLPSFSLLSQNFVETAWGPTSAGVHYSGLSIWSALTLFLPSLDQAYPSVVVTGALMLTAYFYMWKTKSTHSLFVTVKFFALATAVPLLAYRFVGENFFIWLLPFGSILALEGLTVRRLHLCLSLVALLSSVTNSLLPYYMLPLAPWIGNFLVSILTTAAPYRVAPSGEVIQGLSLGKLFLSSLGIVSASTIALSMMKWTRIRDLVPVHSNRGNPIEQE